MEKSIAKHPYRNQPIKTTTSKLPIKTNWRCGFDRWLEKRHWTAELFIFIMALICLASLFALFVFFFLVLPIKIGLRFGPWWGVSVFATYPPIIFLLSLPLIRKYGREQPKD